MSEELWIPGPTQVAEDVARECARPMIGHRSQAMTDLLESIGPGLQSLFGTSTNIIPVAASASGLMEGAMRNLVGDKVLCCVNGAFAKRWFDIAAACGKEAHKLEIAWGEGFRGPMIAEAIKKHGPFDAVAVTHNETSTGALSDLPTIACAVAEFPDTLLMLDCVSSLAATPLDFDKNQLDLVLAGVQKAMALPPGLSLLGLSEKARQRAATMPGRGWYFDFAKLAQGMEKPATPSTPAIPQLYALARQLRKVEEKGGWENRYREHAAMAGRVDAWMKEHGLEHFPSTDFRSPTTACIKAGKLDVPRFVAGLREKGFVISQGYGDLKKETFRIGHMGDHTVSGLDRLLSAATKVIASL